MQGCSLNRKAKVAASFVEKSTKAVPTGNRKLKFYSGDAFQRPPLVFSKKRSAKRITSGLVTSLSQVTQLHCRIYV